MRELEGQALSDVFREVAGTRVGNIGLLLLVRPREMAVKTSKRVMLLMVAVRRRGAERVADEVKSSSSRSVFYTTPSLPLLVH